MESEVELKEGRGADLVMIASRTKQGTGTLELVGVKQKSNMESELKTKEARALDQTDLRRINVINNDGCHRDCNHGICWIPGDIGIEQQNKE